MTPALYGSVLYGADETVCRLVASMIPSMAGTPFPADAKALGVVRGGQLCGGVVFTNYRGHLVEMSGAFSRADWALPETLRRLFAYPFLDLKVENLVTVTGRKNKRARRMNEGLGFKLVGVVDRGYDGREDAVMYQMPREACRWLPKD